MRISIHAPRTGSDAKAAGDAIRAVTFQSTLPARGATLSRQDNRREDEAFQSTLPARGATLPGSGRTGRPPYFNPRSPHGERREPMISLFGAFVFQSTLPARGATNCTAPGLPRGGTFQSTLPARGATGCAPAERRNKSISIHAPRTGSDAIPRVQAFQSDISIHAPRTGSDPR